MKRMAVVPRKRTSRDSICEMDGKVEFVLKGELAHKSPEGYPVTGKGRVFMGRRIS
jgi:hypothetical protein